MSHVDFKKCPCRRVEFRGLGPSHGGGLGNSTTLIQTCSMSLTGLTESAWGLIVLTDGLMKLTSYLHAIHTLVVATVMEITFIFQ